MTDTCPICDGPPDCQQKWGCLYNYLSPPHIRTRTNRVLGFIASLTAGLLIFTT